MRLLAPLLVLALLAGCTEPQDGAQPGDNPNFRVTGSFDGNATQQDYDRASGIATSYGGTMQLLESFPVQFSVSGLGDVACQKVSAALRAEPHVARVGDCQPQGGV